MTLKRRILRALRWLNRPLFVGGFEEIPRPTFEVDAELEDRIRAAYRRLPDNSVKRLIDVR